MRAALAWVDRWFFTFVYAAATGANLGSLVASIGHGDTLTIIIYTLWTLVFAALFVWFWRKAWNATRYTITLQANDRVTAERAVAALKRSGVAK